MSNRLANKITVITGATSGIGEATARRFIEEGATVVLAGRSEEKGEALAKELGERAVFKRTDIMSEDDIAGLVDFTVEKFGRLDCLFNNAGAGDRTTVDSFDEDEFARIMRLLVGAPAFGIKHAARVMKNSGGGSIINNASIAGHRLNQGGYLYSGAKAAVAHMTRLAGADLGPHNIRVNTVGPTFIKTPLTEPTFARPELKAWVEEKIKLGRIGEVEDIMGAVQYLASDASSMVTGTSLLIDGGWTAG